MPKRIALNALSAQVGGGVSAFVNLMPALARVDSKNQYIVFLSKKQKEILEVIPENFSKVIVGYNSSNPYVRILWEQLIFPFYILFYSVDVLYSVGNITTLLSPCKVVLLIENSNPYSSLNIKWTKKHVLEKNFRKFFGWLSAKRANKIRFVSNNSKAILVKELCLPDEKCVTIYHGFNKKSFSRETNGKSSFNPEHVGKYILTVAVVTPHKNLHILIEAFKVIIEKYHYKGNLVIVGDLCYLDYANQICTMIDKLVLHGRVILTGKVENSRIHTYYKNADCFVMPSVEEPFCLPVLEAMGYQVPLAVSDNYVPELKDCFIPFREVCGDAAHYFNPLDPEDIAYGINKIVSEQSYKEQLVLQGKMQAQKYSWEKTAKALINVFESL